MVLMNWMGFYTRTTLFKSKILPQYSYLYCWRHKKLLESCENAFTVDVGLMDCKKMHLSEIVPLYHNVAVSGGMMIMHFSQWLIHQVELLWMHFLPLTTRILSVKYVFRKLLFPFSIIGLENLWRNILCRYYFFMWLANMKHCLL